MHDSDNKLISLRLWNDNISWSMKNCFPASHRVQRWREIKQGKYKSDWKLRLYLKGYKLEYSQEGHRNQRINQSETSLAFWKKAAEQRIEAMKANNPSPIISDTPATTKSNTPCKLNPIISIAISPFLWFSSFPFLILYKIQQFLAFLVTVYLWVGVYISLYSIDSSSSSSSSSWEGRYIFRQVADTHPLQRSNQTKERGRFKSAMGWAFRIMGPAQLNENFYLFFSNMFCFCL